MTDISPLKRVLMRLVRGTAPKCYCGSLEWTVRHYGRITHKHGCPARTDPFCQSHRDGCPSSSYTPTGEVKA